MSKKYPNGTKVTKEEIDKIKLLISKGLNNSEIQEVTGWSQITIRRVKNGQYDEKPKNQTLPCEMEALKDLMAKNLEILIAIDEAIKRGSEVAKNE